MVFRERFVQRMHDSYGHLGFPGLLGAIGNRAWWPSMRKDIQEVARRCPACQVSQRSQQNLERGKQFHMFGGDVQPFERWGIDLIGRLPTTPNGNNWIITAVDYATGWPVARAVPEATDEAIAIFLHEEIFVHYGAMAELMSDNGPNLLSKVVAHYVQLLKTRHRVTTPHHPRTNGRIERLNGILGAMLTKMLMGKPTRLWDEYLSQAILATRVRVHSVSRVSPFELVYGIKPRLPEDSTLTEQVQQEDRVSRIHHARALANERLLKHAVKRQVIRDELVKHHSFEKGDWVLVRNETPQKFQSKWFGPYKVLKSHPLGTYAIQEPNGRVVRNLVNGARLIKAEIDKPERLWASTRMQAELKKAGLELVKPVEVRQILEAVEPAIPPYSDLSTMTKAEWDRRERSGEHSGKVGEENVVEKLEKRRRAKGRRLNRQKNILTTAPPVEESRTSMERVQESTSDPEWEPQGDSPISNVDEAAGRPGKPLTRRQPGRDAKQADFDGPFAVVIPRRRE